jgi:hypothetical protein
MARHLTGSTYFFSCYPDFNSHDIDEVEIIETEQFKYQRHLSGQGKCLFQLKKRNTVEEYIQAALTGSIGMAICNFLVPEFCEEIGFKITDLHHLQPLVDRLDKKHMYLKFIYDSYLANGAFVLSEEQRIAAYKNYKESRGI